VTELLVEVESAELLLHEKTIEQGLKTFVDVGNALLAIRDKRLYRQQWGTFEDYCQERWGMERRHAYRLMDAAQSVENVSNWTQTLPATESQARPLTKLEPDLQPVAWQRAVETAPNGKVTAAHVEATAKTFLPPNATPVKLQPTQAAGVRTLVTPYVPSDDVRFVPAEPPDDDEVEEEQSGDEYYTPEYIIDAARAVLGGIDLDPASCERAQGVVQAGEYYSREENGLTKTWRGSVWLNPPFSKPSPFVMKMIEEYEAGNVESAIVLTNNSTETRWGQALLSRYPVCFVGANEGRRSRISFWRQTPDNPDPSNRYSQMIFYLGEDPQKFVDVFSKFGPILEKK